MDTKKKRQDVDEKLIEGNQKHFKGLKVIPLMGKDMKPADVEKVFQANIDKWDASDAAKQAAKAALEAARESEKATAPTRRAYRTFVVAAMGDASPRLADFGMQPHKSRRKLTSDEKVLATTRAKATRKARGTMGPRQKEKVVGTTPAGSTDGAATEGTSGKTNGASGAHAVSA